MTPELKARQEIDRLLKVAGWQVGDFAQANIHAAREFRLHNLDHGNQWRGRLRDLEKLGALISSANDEASLLEFARAWVRHLFIPSNARHSRFANGQ